MLHCTKFVIHFGDMFGVYKKMCECAREREIKGALNSQCVHPFYTMWSNSCLFIERGSVVRFSSNAINLFRFPFSWLSTSNSLNLFHLDCFFFQLVVGRRFFPLVFVFLLQLATFFFLSSITCRSRAHSSQMYHLWFLSFKTIFCFAVMLSQLNGNETDDWWKHRNESVFFLFYLSSARLKSIKIQNYQ